MKLIFIPFEGIKHVLFACFASKRKADLTCETSINGSEYSFLSEYFEAKLSEYIQEEPMIP
jgi:hypothetical protein